MPRSLSSFFAKPTSASAFPGRLDRIAERQRDFALAALQQVEVLDRRLGRLHLGARTRNLFTVDLAERHAERVVDAAGAAGQDVDELVGLGGRRNQRGGGHGQNMASLDESDQGCLL